MTIAAAGGVTLQGATATSGQYSVVVLVKQGTDTWLVAKSGASGYSGYSGGAGAAGVSGFSGFSGTGPSGFSGYSGAGLSGFSGFSSLSGFSGYSSLSGFSGFSGKSGYSGYSGSGFSGYSGAGLSGFSGYSSTAPGTSGFSGFSGGGPSGFSGYSGAGLSGFSGYSSFSGYSGFSGKSGYSGFSGPSLLTFSTQTDTDYTLVLGDANTGVKMASGSPHNLTIPLNASVPFPIGAQIPIEQGSSGVVTIVATGGVTLQGATTTAGQYSMIVLIKQGTDTWLAATGNSGYSGFSGRSGYSGYSGYSGFSAFSGFSGAGGWIKLTVTGSDATTTGQLLTDITGLVTGTLAVSTLYSIHAVLYVSTSSDTSGIKYGIHAGGTGAAATVNALCFGTTVVAGTIGETISVIDTQTGNAFLSSAATSGTIEITGWVVTRSTGTPTISIQHLKLVGGTR